MRTFIHIIIIIYSIMNSPLCLLASSSPPVYTYKIIKAYPHDQDAFTEGLVFENGDLFESTGIKGRSTIRQVNLEDGKILSLHKLEHVFFGEGITIYKDRIIQLTYQSHLGFVYNKKTLKPIGKFNYPTQGWGITSDGQQLIMSDGTSKLYFLDPETFKLLRWVEVHTDKGPVSGLNELEYIQGEIFANVYPTERIVKIAPQTGEVTGWINLEGILNGENPLKPGCSLNGIAYDAEKNRIFVTGKFYPKVFEIEILPMSGGADGIRTRDLLRDRETP